jgi:hypothetical protein
MWRKQRVESRANTGDTVEQALLAGTHGIGRDGVEAMREQPADETGETFMRLIGKGGN